MAQKSLMDPINTTNTLVQAQTDMCRSYANGSIGTIVSGLMWLISATVAYQYSTKKAIWTLLIGGMLIQPVSVLLYKIIGLSGNHTKGNPLGNLGMEVTIFMIMCLPIAFGLSLQYSEWFFQGMLLIIGGRYLTFSSIYGIRLYWILGAILGVAAYLLFYNGVKSFGTLLTGSLIEILFGTFMFLSFRRNNKNI
jgi:hypothetical protein